MEGSEIAYNVGFPFLPVGLDKNSVGLDKNCRTENVLGGKKKSQNNFCRARHKLKNIGFGILTLQFFNISGHDHDQK